MTDLAGEANSVSRTASCGCGALKVTVAGAPIEVQACSCRQCQRTSGSAFTYTAFFPEAAITATVGEYQSWRRTGNSGEWVESSFCGTCGISVFSRLGVWPGVIGLAIGCMPDAALGKPSKLFWSSERYPWLAFPKDIEIFETQ